MSYFLKESEQRSSSFRCKILGSFRSARLYSCETDIRLDFCDPRVAYWAYLLIE